MSYLHKNNVIHRDLKPENILIDDYLYPKIADFGLSKITYALSMSMNFQSQNGLKGTPIYMAPEILTDEKYTKSSDVYAFSFIVYELLTLEVPFTNFSMQKIFKMIVTQGYRPEIKEDIPNCYKELIEKCWSQNPDERPSFEEIIKDLKNNPDYITDLVDEAEFFDYVDYIDNYQSTFDVSKRIVHFDDFIKVHGRNKVVRKVTINKIEPTKNENDEKNNNKEKHENDFNVEEISDDYNSDDEQSEEEESKAKEDDSIRRDTMIKTASMLLPSKISQKTKIEDEIKEVLLYPKDKFEELSKECQDLVQQATNDAQKKFLVGKYLIEGTNGFPNFPLLGARYLLQSVMLQCLEGTIYYIGLLIKGEIVDQDFKLAKFLLDKIPSTDPRYNNLNAEIYKEELKCYEKEAKEGNDESMYKYAKALFYGEGTKKEL